MKLFKKFAMVFVAAFALVLSLASCEKGPTLEDAAKRIILTQDKQEVSGDFQVPAVVKVDDVTFTVTWTSDNEVAKIVDDADANYKLVKVDYLHNTSAEQAVKLTATISNGKKSTEKQFEFKVPQFVVQTIAQYDAMLDGEMTTVHGIVVAKETYDPGYGNTSIYVAAKDGKGGVYAYRLKCTQEQYDNELVIGANVYISGAKKMYNGLREYDGSCTYILESSEITTPTVTDVTDLIKAGTKLSADYQNQLIKFSGLEILKIDDKDDKGRYNITVGEGNNKFVVRVNTYITPKDGDSYKAYEELELTPGMIISASGVCGWYNTAQMHPINANDIVVEGINHGQAMAAELAKSVELEDKYYGIKDIELPLTLKGEDYAGYTATWASSSENVVVDGALATTKLVAADETVKLTVTVKDANGTVKGTAEVTVKLASKEFTTAVVTAPVKDTEYYLALTQTNTNKVFFFTGAMKGYYGATSQNSADGVKVKLVEVTGGYNISFEVAGKTQYINAQASGEHLNFVIGDKAESVWTHNTQLNAFQTILGEGETAKTVILGTNNTYNTFGVITADKEKPVYGQLYSVVEKTDTMRVEECYNVINGTVGTKTYEDPATLEFELPYRHATISVTPQEGATTLAWDAITGKLTITPVLGEKTEKITVTITVGTVSESYEFEVVSEKLREVTPTEALTVEDGTKVIVVGTVSAVHKDGAVIKSGEEEATIKAIGITDLLIGAQVKIKGTLETYTNQYSGQSTKQIAKGATYVITSGNATISQVPTMEDNSDVVVTGVVSKINGAWSDQYNNMNVTISDGTKTLYVFRLTTKVAQGDTITVTGKVGSYNGSKQIAEGSTAVVDSTAAENIETIVPEIDKLFGTNTVNQPVKKEFVSPVPGATFEVTLQEGATTLTWNAEKNILTVTPAQTEKEETVKVVIALGEEKVEKTYTVKSLLKSTGLESTIKYESTTTTNMDGTNQAELLGLDSSIFSVVGDKGGTSNNVGLNKDGTIRLYCNKSDGNGSSLTIKATGVKITKIIIEFGTKTGEFTVNGTAGSKDTAEYTINGNEVVIKNVQTVNNVQTHFTSITIVYDLAE